MFDGIKILNAQADAEELTKNGLLDWRLHVSQKSGEIESRTAEYRNLRITTKNKNVQVRGSLHKYANSGTHNADDFRRSRIVSTVQDLETSLGIGPNSILNNLEFGVNVVTPFPVVDFLERLICHKGVPFTTHTERGTTYCQCQHKQFVLKIYDKGTEFDLNTNLLRFEVKVLRMQYLRGKGAAVTSLADLTNPKFYPLLGEILLTHFTEIVFDEPGIDPGGMDRKQYDLLTFGRNPKNWKTRKSSDFDEKSEYNRVRTEHTRKTKAFSGLLNSHALADRWQQVAAELIRQKWEYLTNDIVSDLPYILNVNMIQKGNSGTDSDTATNDTTNDTDTSKLCPITGADISHQPANTTFLTESTLRKTPDLLNEISEHHRQRPRKRNHPPEYYAAHNVRNAASNGRNNTRRRVEKAIRNSPLFDPAEVVRLTDQQKQQVEYWKGTEHEIKL